MDNDGHTNEQILQFFDSHPDALPLYERFEERVLSMIPDVKIKVQKTQISFYNRHLFACVSFARVRKKKDCPDIYIVITFGLEYRADSPRIDIATEPYPNRWTHHLLISEMSEIDDELMAWVKEAADFADRK
ncbi:MAG TPA: hypothetical protein H9730_12390 [Candidatus Mediterraneibacter stercoripullorum]|nr:hypothetical protein [Candidatus Mediterraneibacter stercoripullorum]